MESVKIENLTYKYKGRDKNVLSGVSLALDFGEILVILGPNGVGKSTLLSCIMSDIKDYSGKITICGTNSRDFASKELSKKIAFVPQMSETFYEYTVEEMLLMGRTPYLPFFARPSEDDVSKVQKILEDNGLLELKDRIFSTLSGGEKQIVLIARALAQDTDIIVLDEPSSALDLKMQARVGTLIKSLAAKNKTVIMTTHNPNTTVLNDCKVLLMGKHGTKFGEAKALINESNLSALYDCEISVVSIEGVGRVCLSKS